MEQRKNSIAHFSTNTKHEGSLVLYQEAYHLLVIISESTLNTAFVVLPYNTVHALFNDR